MVYLYLSSEYRLSRARAKMTTGVRYFVFLAHRTRALVNFLKKKKEK